MEYQKSCYVNESYPLLEFLLMDSENDLNETFFFFGRGVPKDVAKNFKNSWHLNTYFKKKNKFTKYFEMYFLYKNLEKFLKKEKLENKDMYMQDDVSYSQFFLNHIDNCFLLENGLANYDLKVLENAQRITKKKTIKIYRDKFLKRSKYNYKIFGLSERIKKIYLTGIAEVPEIIKGKTEIVDIKEKWENLSTIKKEKILSMFNFKLLNSEKLKEKRLLITQPLSEDGIVTEKEKIDMYKEIIKDYSLEDIVIKKHPREKTNYENVFPEAYIIKEQFPLEILMLLRVPFKEVITLFSTAALNFKGVVNVNFVGTEKYKKLEKEYGKKESVYYSVKD